MAITYHAGRRVQGLERTGNTPDVEEDFSTDNSYDTQTGTAYTVDYTTDDRIEFDFTKDGSTHEVSFDLESMGGFTMDSSSWIADWTFKVIDSFAQASTSGAHATMAISSVADSGNNQTGDHVAVEIRNVAGAGSLMNLTGGVNSGMDNVRTTGSVDVGTNGFERFIRLTKNGNTCTLQIYTDSNRSTTPTTHTITLAHTVDMKYFRVLNFTGANGGSNAAGNLSVDDFKFYNGITSAPVAPAGDVKPTNVQAGSRFEETDTRKMYHYGGVAGAIIKDAQATVNTSSTGTDNPTLSLTVGDNYNRILVVCAFRYGSGGDISGINWTPTGGSAEPFVTESGMVQDGTTETGRTEIWYLINPTVGAGTVAATWDASTDRRSIGVYSFYNVKQTSPIGVTDDDDGSATVTTSTITPTTVGSMIVDCIGSGSNGAPVDTLTAGWTSLIGGDDRIHSSQYNLTPTIGSANTMAWTFTNVKGVNWIAVEIKSLKWSEEGT